MSARRCSRARARATCTANSWRLVPVNAALGARARRSPRSRDRGARGCSCSPCSPARWLRRSSHCSVTLVRTGNLALADAWEGLRLHWRRGLVLGAAGVGARRARRARCPFLHAGRARLAVRLPHALPRRPARHLRGRAGDARSRRARAAAAARCPEAAALGARRPGATLLLGLALLLVNLAGVAAAVMPFLTITVAYSFVAVAHFALPAEAREV